MRTPSSEDILRCSNGCCSRILFLTPISSVNSVKPSSMCTPKVHSFPFQLHAAKVENKTEVTERRRAIPVNWSCFHINLDFEFSGGILTHSPEFSCNTLVEWEAKTCLLSQKEKRSKSYLMEHNLIVILKHVIVGWTSLPSPHAASRGQCIKMYVELFLSLSSYPEYAFLREYKIWIMEVKNSQAACIQWNLQQLVYFFCIITLLNTNSKNCFPF